MVEGGAEGCIGVERGGEEGRRGGAEEERRGVWSGISLFSCVVEGLICMQSLVIEKVLIIS